MTRHEALDFIRVSEATGFRYGDLSYITEKQDAIEDIENMDDDAWNNGEVFEATKKGVYEMTQTDHEIMVTIVRRANRELRMDSMTLALDLVHCIKRQSLDLEKLRDFPSLDFAHDIFGIHANLDHATYELENGFLPRCAN